MDAVQVFGIQVAERQTGHSEWTDSAIIPTWYLRSRNLQKVLLFFHFYKHHLNFSNWTNFSSIRVFCTFLNKFQKIHSILFFISIFETFFQNLNKDDVKRSNSIMKILNLSIAKNIKIDILLPMDAIQDLVLVGLANSQGNCLKRNYQLLFKFVFTVAKFKLVNWQCVLLYIIFSRKFVHAWMMWGMEIVYQWESGDPLDDGRIEVLLDDGHGDVLQQQNWRVHGHVHVLHFSVNQSNHLMFRKISF